jgi:hypothetical protein
VTWVRLNDTWYSDPDTLELSDAAQAGFVRLLSWSASQRTDGVLRRSVLTVARVSTDSIAELVAAALLTDTNDGWQIVDPEKYLFTEAMRHQKVEAGKKGGAGRWHSDGMAPPMAPAMAPPMAYPSRPVPFPSRPAPDERKPTYEEVVEKTQRLMEERAATHGRGTV